MFARVLIYLDVCIIIFIKGTLFLFLQIAIPFIVLSIAGFVLFVVGFGIRNVRLVIPISMGGFQ